MLTRDEEGAPRVKVIDLGIAKALDKTVEMTSTGVFLGKVKYCSPEQLGGLSKGEALDGRSDLYSLGIVLYEMLTGQRPLRGETPRELFAAHLFNAPTPFSETDPAGRVPEPLRAAVMKALEKKREDRFTSADDFDREILRMRAEVGNVDQSDATMRMISNFSVTPLPPAESVTGSAQDRLDRQFRAVTTPTPMKASGLTPLPPPVSMTDPTVVHPGSTPPPLPPGSTGHPADERPTRPFPTKPAPPKSKAPLFIGAAVLVLGAAGYLVLRPKPEPARPPAPKPAEQPRVTSAAAVPTAAAAEPTEAPKVEPTSAATAAPPSGAEASRLKAPAEAARGRSARAREKAERGRAAELARNPYEQARAQERDAQRLFDQASYGAAQVAFETAAQLYHSAEVTAAGAAVSARPTETIASVQPTARAEPPVRPTTAPVVEPRPPATAPPVRVTVSDQDRITETLRSYEKAQNSMDLDLYAKVYVGLTPERRQQVSAAWQNFKSQSLKLDCQPASISGASADVSCFERRAFVPQVGTEQHVEGNRSLHLEKRGDTWVITTIK